MGRGRLDTLRECVSLPDGGIEDDPSAGSYSLPVGTDTFFERHADRSNDRLASLWGRTYPRLLVADCLRLGGPSGGHEDRQVEWVSGSCQFGWAAATSRISEHSRRRESPGPRAAGDGRKESDLTSFVTHEDGIGHFRGGSTRWKGGAEVQMRPADLIRAPAGPRTCPNLSLTGSACRSLGPLGRRAERFCSAANRRTLPPPLR